MSNITIKKHDGETEGRYVAHVEGKDGEAYLSYTKVKPNVISADHTIAAELKGTGAAGALVESLIQDARQEGFKIIPTCSYVAKLFDKNPEWADLRAE